MENSVNESNYIEVLVLSYLVEASGELLREIDLDTRLSDFFGSLDDVEFIMNIEQDLGIETTEKDWKDIVTVRDAIELFKNRTNERSES